jgi:hypothetical protein
MIRLVVWTKFTAISDGNSRARSVEVASSALRSGEVFLAEGFGGTELRSDHNHRIDWLRRLENVLIDVDQLAHLRLFVSLVRLVLPAVAIPGRQGAHGSRLLGFLAMVIAASMVIPADRPRILRKPRSA